MLNIQGYVAEATGDNIFIIKNGEIATPPPYAGILEGITRNTVMEIATGLGIKVEEKLFTLFDVYSCDECFLTGTAAEVIPVVEVDGRTIGSGRPGDITNRLIAGIPRIDKDRRHTDLVPTNALRVMPQQARGVRSEQSGRWTHSTGEPLVRLLCREQRKSPVWRQGTAAHRAGAVH